MWRKLPNYQSPTEEELALKQAPSLRVRFILSGIGIISIIAIIAINLVFNYSQRLADLSYDRLLRSALLQMDENVVLVRGEVSIDIPWSVFSTLAQANDDRIFYRVDSSENGFITGYQDLSGEPPKPSKLGEMQFYNNVFSGEKIRVAWLERGLTEANSQGTIRILLAQTRLSREEMASSITTRALQVVVLIVFVTIALITFGSHFVLRPLHRIEDVLEARLPGDLTPITINTPKETHHLKVSINHFMARLQRNLEQLENYTAESAHQLRTPLTSLKALAENARDQTTPERQKEALEQIVLQSDKLSQTVTMLLNQAVVSHRLQTQDLVEIEMNRLVKQICMDLAVSALQQNIYLSFDSSTINATILGDEFSLQQMLTNLIDNAIRYSRHINEDEMAKSVDIHVFQYKAFIGVKIVDYGLGISDDDKIKVFERFYRGQYEISGSGVGLAMVKDIVDRHGATVSVFDTEPQGTTIEVLFPERVLAGERV